MAKNIVDVKAGRLFPFHFLILGGIFLFAALVVIGKHPIAGSILIVLALPILTAYEGTEINPVSKTYREYNSFIFLKGGKEKKYRSLEGIFIHKAKVRQKMYTPRTMSSSTFTHVEFNAYLKVNGEEKIFLISNKDKMKLLARTGEIARALNTSVVDYAMVP